MTDKVKEDSHLVKRNITSVQAAPRNTDTHTHAQKDTFQRLHPKPQELFQIRLRGAVCWGQGGVEGGGGGVEGRGRAAVLICRGLKGSGRSNFTPEAKPDGPLEDAGDCRYNQKWWIDLDVDTATVQQMTQA